MTGAVQCARRVPNVLIINAIRVISALHGVAALIPHSAIYAAWISECEIDIPVYVVAGFLKISLQLLQFIFEAMREVRSLGAQR